VSGGESINIKNLTWIRIIDSNLISSISIKEMGVENDTQIVAQKKGR
jgi:hypothetical protein